MKACEICQRALTGRQSLWCSTECKASAKRAYDRARYLENREATIARAQSWYSVNVDRKREYDAAYREATRDERLAAKREWSRSFQAANPDAVRLRANKRRAAKAANGVLTVTLADLARLLRHYRERCGYCADAFTEINPLEWDHIIPISRGGRHSVGNLIPSCRACNRAKLTRTIMEWRSGKVVSRRTMSVTA